MPNTEQLQNRMMARMLRLKARDHRSIRKMLIEEEEEKRRIEKQKEIEKNAQNDSNQSIIMENLEKLLSTGSETDPELVAAMNLLIPMVLQMYAKTTSWLVRDRTIDCLRQIRRKMGKCIVDKHLATISRGKRHILEQLLNY